MHTEHYVVLRIIPNPNQKPKTERQVKTWIEKQLNISDYGRATVAEVVNEEKD
jgi:hypothetical protein